MKRKLTALLLVLILSLGMMLPVHGENDTLAPWTQAKVLQEVAQFIQEYCLTSSSNDDPLGRVFPDWQQPGALEKALAQDALLYETLLTQMLSGYDSHTMYIPAGTYSLLFSDSGESYVGVGLTLLADENGVFVEDVSLQGSAFSAGILAGDRLISIDGENVQQLPALGVSVRLRGEAGTAVRVTLSRDGREYTVNLTRGALEDPIYQGRALEEHIFYMKWSQFSTEEDSLAKFRADLAKLGKEDCLILDLRDNPGGDLDLACTIASDLLPERCSFFAFTQRCGDKVEKKFFTSDGKGKTLKQICILTDENSASASEVLTASLRDTGYAVVVGTTTYGKARAQYHVELPGDAAAVVTAMGLVSLRDGDYEEVGLKPDVESTKTAVKGNAAYVPTNVALASYSCSDNGTALNQALLALELLETLPEKPYQVGTETMNALHQLRCTYGLADASGADIPTLRLINLLLSQQKRGNYLRDDPLRTALELCHTAQPAQIADKAA